MRSVGQWGVCLSFMLVCTNCASFRRTLGFDHEGPDEFGVAPLAPLSVPKELREPPPAPQSAGGTPAQKTVPPPAAPAPVQGGNVEPAPEEVVRASRLLLGDPHAPAPVITLEKIPPGKVLLLPSAPKTVEEKKQNALKTAKHPVGELEKPQLVVQKVASEPPVLQETLEKETQQQSVAQREGGADLVLTSAGEWRNVSASEIKTAQKAIKAVAQTESDPACAGEEYVRPELMVEPDPMLPAKVAQVAPVRAPAKPRTRVTTLRVKRVLRRPARARQRVASHKRRVVRRRVVRRKGLARKVVYKRVTRKVH